MFETIIGHHTRTQRHDTWMVVQFDSSKSAGAQYNINSGVKYEYCSEPLDCELATSGASSLLHCTSFVALLLDSKIAFIERVQRSDQINRVPF